MVFLLSTSVFIIDFPDYKSLTFEQISHIISGSQVQKDSPILHGVKMIAGPNMLLSYNTSRSPVCLATQGSANVSIPPCPQGLLTSQLCSRSHVSSSDTRRQQKHKIFTEEQKLILQEHFDNCRYLRKKQCMTLPQRFGMNEYHIKLWLILGLPVF